MGVAEGGAGEEAEEEDSPKIKCHNLQTILFDFYVIQFTAHLSVNFFVTWSIFVALLNKCFTLNKAEV